MKIELKMKIMTPYGEAEKMIIKDGEILFYASQIQEVCTDVYPFRKKKTFSSSFSLGQCIIYVEDEESECD